LRGRFIAGSCRADEWIVKRMRRVPGGIRADLVEADCIAHTAGAIRRAALTGPASGAIVAVLLSSSVSRPALWGWWVLLSSCNIGLYFAARAFVGSPDASAPRWSRRALVVGVALSGVLWGAIAPLAVLGSHARGLEMALVVLAGVATSAVAFAAAEPRVFIAFVVPVTVESLTAAAFSSVDHSDALVLAVLLYIFVVGMLYADMHRAVVQGFTLHREMEYLATRDALTGLPNRRLLFEHMQLVASRARREAIDMAVIAIDIDRFKSINDRFGHDVGDKVLVEVAARLEAALRAADVVARLGGDEFVAFLTKATEGEALAIAERLRAAVADPVLLESGTLTVTVSIGVASTRDDVDATAIISAADSALYGAKRAGRNRVMNGAVNVVPR
jgi:diguanylate cyclase (GGDEF)-like protein